LESKKHYEKSPSWGFFFVFRLPLVYIIIKSTIAFMNVFQTSTILAVGIIYLIVLALFCRNFTKNKSLISLLSLPVMLFIFGYFLRINGNKWQIDLGYFLTDTSSLFLYAVFTGSLILGQMKYWKK